MPAAPTPLRPLTARRAGPLHGRVSAPGGAAISHLALVLGLLALGESRIDGLREDAEVLRTVEACRAFGARLCRHGPGDWSIWGCGIGSLLLPVAPLDFGNACAASHLMMGLAGSHGLTATFEGGVDLPQQPTRQILDLLVRMGAEVLEEAAHGDRSMTLRGTPEPAPLNHVLPVPSAAIKSAALLASLNSPGTTTMCEAHATCNAIEMLLRHFGATVTVERFGVEGQKITLAGRPDLRGQRIHVAGSPSAALFPLVAALIVPGSDVLIEGVMLNPKRFGALAALHAMGAKIETLNVRPANGEEIADMRVCHSILRGTEAAAKHVPLGRDDAPILAVAAAFAHGPTRIPGPAGGGLYADRLATIAAGLQQCGVALRSEGDGFIIDGSGKVPGSCRVAADRDPAIAMSFLVLGLGAERGVTVDGAETIATSFPDFHALMNKLGANFEAA